MDSPSTSSSSQKAPTGTSRTQLPALSTTTLTPPEPVQSSNTSYTATQSTPNALAMKMASAMAPQPPMGHVNLIQSRLPGGSNIPNGPNGMYPSGTHSGDPNHPFVTVMAMAPPGASGDAQVDNVRFACLQQCRWMAGCLMAYYVVTFLFLQPFVLGTLGLFTACLGYNGSRSPVDMHRYNWLCWYVRANYGMLILNMWMLIVTLIFSGAIFIPDADASDAYGSRSSDDDVKKSTSLYTKSTSLIVGLLVAVNTIFHLRCLRIAKLLVAELLSAGVDREPAPSLVVAPANPVSVV